MEKLNFQKLNFEDQKKVYNYTSKYGEGSCQHSFVSMISQYEKYSDMICERDGFLFILRSNLCDDEYRVYLAPLGEGDLKKAFGEIIYDAKQYGKKVKFFTLTEYYADFLEKEFPDLFNISLEMDLAEYMYRTEKMSTFSSRKLKRRRGEVNKFRKLYAGHFTVKLITPEDFSDILEFEKNWLKDNAENHDVDALNREYRMIEYQFEHYNELNLSGIVLRIDGKVYGFGYGTKLSDKFYDAIIEKGDKNIPNIYKVLRLESVKQCAMDCEFVNMEEDLGIAGLRNLKLCYRPEYLLNKYIAVER